MSKQEHDAGVAEFRQQMSTFDKPWYRSCSDLVRRKQFRGMQCLDLCSGNCEFSRILRDDYDMDVTCADYIPLHLEQADREGFRLIKVDLDADAEAVDEIAAAQAERFDMVVNLAAVEHVFNSDNLMRFAHTVLKPGGMFIINTPNIGFLGYRVYSSLSGNRPFGEGHHIRFWDYRFLRTNLFLNGFEVTEDFRRFYTLPQEVLRRAFRNRKYLSWLGAKLFYPCYLLQYVPFARGLACDELTVLCRKENVVPIGFHYLRVKGMLEGITDPERKEHIVNRLQKARERGWLNEHLYMSRLVDDHS